jgi:NMD protein affecting ribosome stability and mRNA decay
MNTIPIVVGTTPCCGNIMRTSTRAISFAIYRLNMGVCPDCNINLTEKNFSSSKDVQQARRWFQCNAIKRRGQWLWNANDAFVAYVELHDREG